jgi:hypothetical protein
MSDVFTPIRKEENLTILRPYQLCLGSCNAQHVEYGNFGFLQRQSNF